MITPGHTRNAHLTHRGPEPQPPEPASPATTKACDGALPATTAAPRGEPPWWRAAAEAITYDCILTFDPASGWGHWARAIPGQAPVFLGFVKADPQVRALPDPVGITLAVHRIPGDGGFRVTTDDPHHPKWNTWRVSRTWIREGLREVLLRTALAGR